jgi:hypothetical protein
MVNISPQPLWPKQTNCRYGWREGFVDPRTNLDVL